MDIVSTIYNGSTSGQQPQQNYAPQQGYMMQNYPPQGYQQQQPQYQQQQPQYQQQQQQQPLQQLQPQQPQPQLQPYSEVPPAYSPKM